MKFRSTRRKAPHVTFREAVFKGLAPDGGLYHPIEVPQLSGLLQSLDPELSFTEMSRQVAGSLLGTELGEDTVRRVVERAFPFSPELREVAPGRWLLELFHGPSYAFKDFGASFLASSMEEFLKSAGQTAVVLVATSGDTGSAVARAFHGKRNVRVVILYPSGRVSHLQEMQLTTLGGNVTALEVEGSFDDCQRMVKEAFMDAELGRSLTLTSANSISLGRLLPQAFYYIHAATRLKKRCGDLLFCVPSGNFGNLTAGVYAWQWGMPAQGFLAATNANDVVPEYLTTGIFSPRPSVHTLSNAMDVGNPSNFERLLEIFGGDAKRMSSLIHGAAVTDEQTLAAINRVFDEHQIILDPHTAVGWVAVENYMAEQDGGNAVVLATAHPAKFTETIAEAIGRSPRIPPGLAQALAGRKESTRISNDLTALRGELLSLV